MPGLIQRLKIWADDEQLDHADLNAEFDNIIDNSTPEYVDDLSKDVSSMRATDDPGEPGSESQAASLEEEVKQIRFKLAEIMGEEYWYSTPDQSISQLLAPIVTPTKRVLSGRINEYGQPMFLTPVDGVARFAFRATETPMIAYINGGLIEFGKDLTANNLFTGPATLNTCQVNDASLSGQDFTKYLGEGDSSIPVDNVGTEMAAKAGTIQAYKLVHGGVTEYFLAEYDSANGLLKKATRGGFFSPVDAEFPRLVISNDDVISLMRAVYVFVLDESPRSLLVTYDRPAVSFDEPNTSDVWFDLQNNVWKRQVSGAFQTIRAAYLGVGILNSTAAVAARSADFARNFSPENGATFKRDDAQTISPVEDRTVVSVYGKKVPLSSATKWSMINHLEAGVTEAASTTYFFYLGPNGEQLISDRAPQYRFHDLFGAYHPTKPYRCLASVFNDSSSNLLTSISNETLETLPAPTGPYRQSIQASPVDASDVAETDVQAFLTTPERCAPSALCPVVAPFFLNKGVTTEYAPSRFELSLGGTVAGSDPSWQHIPSQILYNSGHLLLRKNSGQLGITVESGEGWLVPSSSQEVAATFLKYKADGIAAGTGAIGIGARKIMSGGRVTLSTAGGTAHGSTYTKVRRFSETSVVAIVGIGTIAYVESTAELGTILYIARSGIWSFEFQDSYSGGTSITAITTDNSNIFGVYTSLFDTGRLAVTEAASGTIGIASHVGFVGSGTRVYPLTGGNNDSASPRFSFQFLGGA